MNISQKGIDIIKKFEGCKLTAYQDQTGVWTIGYGSTENVTPNLTITQDDAEARLINHLSNICSLITGYIKVPCNQNEFDALCSFAYNLGAAALKRSTLLQKMNTGDYMGAADEFHKWCMVAGHPSPGLLRRRVAERTLFLS